MSDILTLAQLASQAYDSQATDGYGSYAYLDHMTDISFADNLWATGFGGYSFYSADERNLVISFAGTNPDIGSDQVMDLWADFQMLMSGQTVQDSQALGFAQQQIAAARAQYGDDISITLVGHSLGGYLSQFVVQALGEGTATVFNSPGMGGGIFGTDEVNEDITYVFSDPRDWGAARMVHALGDILNGNVQVVLGAEGHGLDSIIGALEDGRIALSAQQWGAILAEGLRNGDLRFEDIIPLIGAGDVMTETVLQAMRDSGVECFLAGTPVSMSDGSVKAIEDIRPDDWVMSYDRDGRLVPGRVTRTHVQDATHILDLFGLHVTPGHVMLCGDGRYRGRHVPIIDILRSDGAIIRQNGQRLRAGTGCVLGSPGDGFVLAVTGALRPDGSVEIAERKRIRVGTRFILEDGRDICVGDIIRAGGGTVNGDGLVTTREGGAGVPFHWTLSSSLPQPESYVLQRSAVSLEEIYAAGEWEDMRPVLPAPASGAPPARRPVAPNVPLAMRGHGALATLAGDPRQDRSDAAPDAALSSRRVH